MKLNELKAYLSQQTQISFTLPDGKQVPAHYHVTEVGSINKHFIDCGGVERQERVISLQLWSANDYDHRLHPEKLIHILELSEQKLKLENLTVEVEYQGEETIGKYGLAISENGLLLTSKKTACLAMDQCGVEVPPAVKSFDLELANSGKCTPGSGCC